MPWKASSVMEEKARFVLEYEREEQTMSALCEQFGIARETGYVWLRRYRAQGLAGLLELNRAAKRHPNQTAAAIEQAVLELRGAHMRWGPRKLKRVLERDQSGRAWPAASTIGEMVKRAGLVVARKQRRKTAPYTEPLAHADACNRVWCADFKGWFRSGDGERIDPLTISDAYSRYLLRCQAVEKTNTERVRAIFEAAFREYGLPAAIRTDNGAPFASCALAGLSRLAVWWMKLGIVPERIAADIRSRMGGTNACTHLKQEVAMPPAADRRAQQRSSIVFGKSTTRFGRTRHWTWKPPPACINRHPARIRVEPEPEYPDSMLVRSVKHQGVFRWKKHDVFLSEVLWTERIGLLPLDERWFTIYFAQLPIASFDSRELRVVAWRKPQGFDMEEAGEGEAFPSPAPLPLDAKQEKVSAMSPV